MLPPFYWGAMVCLCPPHFYFPFELCLYNTDIQLFGIFHIPNNYIVDNFNKLTQMAVIK